MPAFEYLALDSNGRQKKGVLEADTARQIRGQLRELQLTPLQVNEVAEGRGQTGTRSGAGSGSTRRNVRIKTADLALLTRQLATLIRAALPIEEALRAVSDQSEKSAVKSMMLAVRSRVMEGHTLADALGQFPKVFDNLYCSMVAAGERSGHLDEVLERLADYTERRQYLRQKVQMAMVYPLILVIFAIGVVTGLLTFVVPKVVAQFDHLGAELPMLTQLMIGLSDFLKSWGWLLALAIVAGVLALRQILKQPAVALQFDRNLLRWPLIGKLARGINTARFARTLSIMTASAVPVLEGLRIAGDVVDNRWLKQIIQDATTRVREGASLRAALSKTQAFPPMLIHMIGSGESSGQLESMLDKAADNQEREFESMISVTLSLMEPLLIMGMGVMVLVIVLAILLPIFQLNQIIGR